MTKITILILAAGASLRMGAQDKLMQDAQGSPLLARVIGRAKASGLATYVTVPDLAHPRTQLVRKGQATPVPVPGWATGMAASIRAGIAALPQETGGVMIIPGDMPDLQTDDLQALAATAKTAPGAIIRATTASGTPGHPVIFPADLFHELQRLTGDNGARPVIKAHPDRVHTQVLAGNRAIRDLDTPADWAAWTAKQSSRK